MRKIIHIDMDAFYASVEQRDRPEWRGRPVIVAWRGPRSVVCAASYEARRHGVRSAMPTVRAERLCPQGVFTPPDFPRYRAVSREIRGIFLRYTDLVEPLSLDEAYLDVTMNKSDLPTATEIARAIRAAIRSETDLTASAGVAPNKFLAKIASDWRKPDGLFVIQPHEVQGFLEPLPAARLPGVGKATLERLHRLGIETAGDLRMRPREELEAQFGRFGVRLHGLARGSDDQAVVSDRPVQSVSAETTFDTDLLIAELLPAVRESAAKAWRAARRTERIGRSVVLKLKTREFKTITRTLTPALPPATEAEFVALAERLLERVGLPPRTRYRLAGVGLSNFTAPECSPQPGLFDGA